jgi:ribulose-5-phosphate 4-epimerase/fuculose-1-phosphate aldolase
MIWNRSLSANEISQLYQSSIHKNGSDEALLFINKSSKGNFSAVITSSNRVDWNVLINQSGIVVGNSYGYNLGVVDLAGNINNTDARTIIGNTAPTFITILSSINLTSKNGLNSLDPNVNVVITTNISDADDNFDSAILQWKNLTSTWNNITLANITSKGIYTKLNLD